MSRGLTIGAIVLGAALFIVYLAAFTVREDQQALVLRFGRVANVVQDAGLNFKYPIIDNVEYIEKRVLDFDVIPQELILGDRKRLVVDSFARYRITDPQVFYQRVRTEEGLQGQMQPILNSAMRNVLGSVPLFTVLSADRVALMADIRERANVALNQYGVDVVDIRIKRADLPEENSQAIYRRMQTERQREASELRAQGAEQAQRIRARAERERTVLLAEAKRDSEIIRGTGDADAVRIFAESFGRDKEFFAFYRSMQAYRQALAGDSTNFVMSPDSEFFQYMDSSALDILTAGREDVPDESEIGAVEGTEDEPSPLDVLDQAAVRANQDVGDEATATETQ
ncbi:MAG: protease modulator HflC [Geminicoccaceae bacterium]